MTINILNVTLVHELSGKWLRAQVTLLIKYLIQA